ncbi:MAG TPA: YbjN domain-containing protein [Chroococcales cyanobacterium]
MFGTKMTVKGKGTPEEVVDMLRKYFERRGLNLNGHEVEGCPGFGYWLTEGSAKIYIFIQECREGPALRVSSPILKFPENNREAFFKKLLELNRDMIGCCISVVDDIVMVGTQRSTKGLDQEELNELVWNVSYVADLLDDQLAADFGAPLYVEAPV